MKIKLLALDMDGTAYYTRGGIVPKNLQPIKQAINQGVHVSFITGRPILSPNNYFSDYGLITPSTVAAGYNGALIYHLQDQKILYQNLISSKSSHSIFKLVKELGNKETIVFGHVSTFDTMVLNRKIPIVKDSKDFYYGGELEFFEGKYEIYDSKIDHEYFKFAIFNGNKTLFKELEKRGFNMTIENDDYAEVNAPGAHKGTALKWISDYHKVELENVMAIGDGHNDLPMMRDIKHSVSLANSIPELKNITRHKIHLTNEDGGVAYAINNLILKKGI